MSMQLQDYSERSFVIFGDDTKIHKDKLKELGGKYNSNLSIGKGWIFSKKSQEKVNEWMNSLNPKVEKSNFKSKIIELLHNMNEQEIEIIYNKINKICEVRKQLSTHILKEITSKLTVGRIENDLEAYDELQIQQFMNTNKNVIDLMMNEMIEDYSEDNLDELINPSSPDWISEYTNEHLKYPDDDEH